MRLGTGGFSALKPKGRRPEGFVHSGVHTGFSAWGGGGGGGGGEHLEISVINGVLQYSLEQFH